MVGFGTSEFDVNWGKSWCSDLIWELLTIDHLNWRLNMEEDLNKGILNGDSAVFVIIITTNHLMTGVQPTPKSMYYQMYLRQCSMS